MPAIMAAPVPIGATAVACPVARSMVYSEVLPPTRRAARGVPNSVMSNEAAGSDGAQSILTPSGPTRVICPRFGEGLPFDPPSRTSQSLAPSMPNSVVAAAPATLSLYARPTV